MGLLEIIQMIELQLHDLPAPWLHTFLQDYLTPKERLSLFQVGRGMATLVLLHAADVHLALTHEGTAKAQQAMETLLPSERDMNLTVHLKDGVTTLWTVSIRRQVKHLTLGGIDLTADMLQNQLQLQHCSKLHTLVCSGVDRFEMHLQELAQQCIDFLPPALTTLTVDSHDSEATAAIVRLAGPQLTHLSFKRWPHGCSMDMLSQLSHITVWGMDHVVMDKVMDVPNLTHVSINSLRLYGQCSIKQPRWQQLELLWGCRIHELQGLALQQIQCLVIHADMYCERPDTVQQDVTHLATCPKLRCVPARVELEGTSDYYEFTIHDHHPSELVTLCVHNMDKRGGICLKGISTLAIQQLLPCIYSLPCNVTSLRLSFDSEFSRNTSAEQRVKILCQLVDALPMHIEQLILWFSARLMGSVTYESDACTYASAVVSRLKDRRKPAKLLAACGCLEPMPAGLHALAEIHPEHMRCAHMSYSTTY